MKNSTHDGDSRGYELFIGTHFRWMKTSHAKKQIFSLKNTFFSWEIPTSWLRKWKKMPRRARFGVKRATEENRLHVKYQRTQLWSWSRPLVKRLSLSREKFKLYSDDLRMAAAADDNGWDAKLAQSVDTGIKRDDCTVSWFDEWRRSDVSLRCGGG